MPKCNSTAIIQKTGTGDVKKITIGELLKKRRTELSLTQRQVANQVGANETTVSRWKFGDIDNMRHDKVANFAKALSVSPLLIMGIDDVENLYKPVSKDELKLLNDYRGVDAEDRSIELKADVSTTKQEIKQQIDSKIDSFLAEFSDRDNQRHKEMLAIQERIDTNKA